MTRKKNIFFKLHLHFLKAIINMGIHKKGRGRKKENEIKRKRSKPISLNKNSSHICALQTFSGRGIRKLALEISL